MRESELLAHIYRRSSGIAAGPIRLGPGDDCGIVHLEGEILFTVDHLIEGRHFAGGAASPGVDLIGRKAVARSVSDIAAMGGIPVCSLAAACLPEGYTLANELFDAVHRWGRQFGSPVIGGDIATYPGPLAISITVVGTVHPQRGAVLRSTAKVGDIVYVTGKLGGSLASGRHLTFEPRIPEARWLCDTLGAALHSMIDLSDGLGRDAGRVAEASNVRIELNADQLPRHQGVDCWQSAVGDGEDYELMFTVAATSDLPSVVPGTSTPLTRIGRVVAGAGCTIQLAGGGIVDVSSMGWDHEA